VEALVGRDPDIDLRVLDVAMGLRSDQSQAIEAAARGAAAGARKAVAGAEPA